MPPALERPPVIDPCEGELVFGPEAWSRMAGPPDEHRARFELPEPASVCLRLRNEGLAAATVTVDGARVVGPSAFNPNVRSIERRVPLDAGTHELVGRLASRPGASLEVEIRFAPFGAPSRHERALAQVQRAVDVEVESELERLGPEGAARLLNALAWYDDAPHELRVRQGRRGGLTHLSGRFLAYDLAPELPGEPTSARAELYLEDCEGGRALLNLRDEDALELTRSIPQPDEGVRFIYEQRWRGVPVHDAWIALDLDRYGRLTRLASSLIPGIAPPPPGTLSRNEAVEIALMHVRGLDEPLWEGVEPALQAVDEVIVHRHPHTGDDDERPGWRVRILAETPVVAGDREVVVDRVSGEVIASIEHARFLGPQDRVVGAEGRIAFGGVTLREDIEHWNGSLFCASPAEPGTGDTPLDRDIDEVAAAACEAVHLFAERGGELSRPDFRDWLDPGRQGLLFGVGVDPELSIAMRTRTPFGQELTVYARGAARADAVGHELGHIVYGAGGPIPFSRGPGGEDGSMVAAEGAAIEEHMVDALGMLLEGRFALRGEDDCLIGDQEDTRQTISMARTEHRPCSLLGREIEWRSLCEPEQDNGGWCEGAARYGDIGYNRYDIYGQDSGPTAHIASHTNLGVGNRAFAAIWGASGEPGTAIDGFFVDALGQLTSERLWFYASNWMVNHTDWTSYGTAWTDAALRLFGASVVTPEERAVRSALLGVGLWSSPRTMQVSTFPPAPAPGPPAVVPTPASRPAVAQLELTDGVVRTYFFYRPDAESDRLAYVFGDETPGGRFAATPRRFFGPCELPFEARTFESPAAAASDGAVFLAWAEPTGEPEVGRLRGAVLPADGAGPGLTCADEWEPLEPSVERRLRGAPALAVWAGSTGDISCEVLGDFGVLPPFRTIGPMGFSIGDCVEVGEPVFSFIPQLGFDFGQRLVDLLIPTLDLAQNRPAFYDLAGPARDFADDLVRHRVPLASLLQNDPDALAALTQFDAPFDEAFEEALGKLGATDRLGFELAFDARIEDIVLLGGGGAGDPFGSIERIHLRFPEQRLAVAFRDEAGALRLSDFSEERATSALPLMDAAPNATDPALAVVRQRDAVAGSRFDRELLYVIYGTSEVVEGTPVPTRLSYRVAPRMGGAARIEEGLFDAPRRLDLFEETRGVRRQVDYRLARTLRAPVAVGADERLHLFTVSFRIPVFRPDPDGRLGLDEDDEMPLGASRIRHAELEALPSGELRWSNERPVLLTDTSVLTPVDRAEAGAALVARGRSHLRFYYPTGARVSIRSRVLR